MREQLAFLLPPATALVGMRLCRWALGPGGHARFGLGLRFALGLAVGMLVLAQALLLLTLVGLPASRWLAFAVLLWALVELGLRLPRALAGLRAPRLARAHLQLLLLFPLAYAFWVFGRLSTLEGTLEFDAHAFWAFKAKVLYLVQGRGLLEVLHQPDLAYAHLDYPMLVPSLYALGYGAVGSVNEFVNKVWPFWMVVALCLAILSLGEVWRRPRPLPLLTVLVFVFLPATLQFMRNEGGTIPMVFFVSLAALLLQQAISDGDEPSLAAGLLLLAGGAMTKFEGMVYAVLWACLLLAIGRQHGWLRCAGLLQAPRWRSALFAGISLLPYGVYRLAGPVPHPESGFWQAGLRSPAATWFRLPQAWFLDVAGRFFDTEFFRWQSLDGDRLHWAGRFAGLGSLVNDQLSVLPWLLLVLLAFTYWRGRARLALLSLSLVILGVFTTLSLVIACLPRMQSHLSRVIEFSTANQVGRYCYPFFVAWFLATAAVWFDDARSPSGRDPPA
jgi:hypothetical protein